MRIAVLIKQVPDTWSDRRLDPATGRVDRTLGDQVIDEIDERALEVALRHRDTNKNTEVVAISMGPDGVRDALRRALSIGADSAVHIVDEGLVGADATLTSRVLAAALQKGVYDLVIAGNVSTDGRAGVVPAMIAEHLGWPQLSSLDVVEIGRDAVRGERTIEAGRQSLHAALPAILTVSERTIEARFPTFKNLLSAKKKPLTLSKLADLDDGTCAAVSVVLSVVERPPREAGRVVVDDGHAVGELVDFLAAQRII
jgi:electron transfer flavoprotein beta subunit